MTGTQPSTARRATALLAASGAVVTVFLAAPSVAQATTVADKPAHVTLTPHHGKQDGKYYSVVPSKFSMTATVSPNRSGERVTFSAQKLIKGKWTAAGSDSETLDDNSKSETQFGGPVGSRFRFYARYPGDSGTSSAKSAALYVKYHK